MPQRMRKAPKQPTRMRKRRQQSKGGAMVEMRKRNQNAPKFWIDSSRAGGCGGFRESIVVVDINEGPQTYTGKCIATYRLRTSSP